MIVNSNRGIYEIYPILISLTQASIATFRFVKVAIIHRNISSVSSRKEFERLWPNCNALCTSDFFSGRCIIYALISWWKTIFLVIVGISVAIPQSEAKERCSDIWLHRSLSYREIKTWHPVFWQCRLIWKDRLSLDHLGWQILIPRCNKVAQRLTYWPTCLFRTKYQSKMLQLGHIEHGI